MRHWLRLAVAFVLVVGVRAAMAQEAQPASEAPKAGAFRITFDPAVQKEAYSGRVYVVLAKQGMREPRLHMGDWMGGPQVFSRDVKDVATGGSVGVGGKDAECLGFPKSWADVEGGEFTVQAVARRSLDSPEPGRGEGDLYSAPQDVVFDRGDTGVVELKLTQVVKERPFQESERVKLVDIVSPSLSTFYGREVRSRAGVVLPEGWKDEPGKKYPTIWFITGFGGNHRSAAGTARMLPRDGVFKDVIWVVPDPTCALGHSVFADSANNGPRGEALVKELIPAVEAKFHGAGAGHRYVTGISSGGWGSLWLQVTYSEEFAGCWSHCPDPVDFRDFQQIDLYAPDANVYRDARGERRPLARQGGSAMLYYDDFVRQETVMGPGGQIHSFEAVFSPRGADGKPVQLFDRMTGAVNPETAKAWEKYDIRLVLERNWKELGPRLKGKLHVYAGGEDTFYLEGAAKLLKESLEKLGSDAEAVIVPGMPHTIYQQGMGEMFEAIREREGAGGGEK